MSDHSTQKAQTHTHTPLLTLYSGFTSSPMNFAFFHSQSPFLLEIPLSQPNLSTLGGATSGDHKLWSATVRRQPLGQKQDYTNVILLSVALLHCISLSLPSPFTLLTTPRSRHVAIHPFSDGALALVTNFGSKLAACPTPCPARPAHSASRRYLLCVAYLTLPHLGYLPSSSKHRLDLFSLSQRHHESRRPPRRPRRDGRFG